MIISQALTDAIEKYLRGEASPEETALVNEWYGSFNDNRVVVTDATTSKEEIDQRMRHTLATLTRQDAPIPEVKPLYAVKTRAIAAAAIGLLITAGLAYLVNRKPANPLR